MEYGSNVYAWCSNYVKLTNGFFQWDNDILYLLD